MNRTDKTLVLVAQLLDKWDDLPNDVTSEPELEQVAQVMSQIENLVDDDSKELDVNDLDIKGIIEKEITWCEEHRGMKSEVYEEAFIAGLKQVLFFINNAQQSVHPTLLTEPVNYCNPVNGVHAPFCTGHKSQSG